MTDDRCLKFSVLLYIFLHTLFMLWLCLILLKWNPTYVYKLKLEVIFAVQETLKWIHTWKTASNVNIRQWKVACGVEFAQTIEIWRHFGVTWNEGSHKFYPLPLETTCSQKLAKPLGISTHTEVFSAQDKIRWRIVE